VVACSVVGAYDRRWKRSRTIKIMEKRSNGCVIVNSPIVGGNAIYVEDYQDPMVAGQRNHATS
jgi:hypothetical protein